jgi:glucokinase
MAPNLSPGSRPRPAGCASFARLSTTPGFAIGVDLGGTDLKAALVREDGTLERFARRPSRTQESAAAPLDAIAEMVADLRAANRSELVGVGVGCPGMIEPGEGRLVDRTAHLPHWGDLPLADELATRTGLRVVLDNDANLAAWAEQRCGAARGAEVAIAITLGTGIGCGIVIGGRVFRGARGGAGELGHVPLGRTGRLCRCGIPDCVEPEASGSGLAEDARELGLDPPDASTLFGAAIAGHAGATKVLERFTDRLGATVGTAVNIFNPEVVVVGGGVAGAGEALLGPLRVAVARYTLPSHRRELRIVLAALGDRAGTVGAGLLAWDQATG